MLNYLWGGMILIGVVVAAFTGRMPNITQAAIESSKEAVMICITMLGIMSMWTGMMKIAEKGGVIKILSDKMSGILRFLFPDIPKNHKALQYISTNLIANALGLGWAATPAGLKAMEELQKLNHHKNVASKSMCMFMIVNMSSVQLLSVNLLAYRAEYASKNPSEIIAPALLATFLSTFFGILAGKILERRAFK